MVVMTLVTGKLERVSAPKNESKQSGTKQPVSAEYFGHQPTAKNTESTSFGDYRHLWGADVLCFVVFCLFDGGGCRNVKDGLSTSYARHAWPRNQPVGAGPFFVFRHPADHAQCWFFHLIRSPTHSPLFDVRMRPNFPRPGQIGGVARNL